MTRKYTIQDVRQTFNCTRKQAEEIMQMIKQLAVEGVCEHEERQAIQNEDILEDEGEFDVPF